MKTLLLIAGLAGFLWCFAGGGSGSRWDQGAAQVSFHGNGQPRRSVTYAAGQRHGPAREWFKDGTLAAEGRFEDGQRVGPWSFWHEDGRPDLERSGVYRRGRLVEPAAAADATLARR